MCNRSARVPTTTAIASQCAIRILLQRCRLVYVTKENGLPRRTASSPVVVDTLAEPTEICAKNDHLAELS